jgi:hypothetical protein
MILKKQSGLIAVLLPRVSVDKLKKLQNPSSRVSSPARIEQGISTLLFKTKSCALSLHVSFYVGSVLSRMCVLITVSVSNSRKFLVNSVSFATKLFWYCVKNLGSVPDCIGHEQCSYAEVHATVSSASLLLHG